MNLTRRKFFFFGMAAGLFPKELISSPAKMAQVGLPWWGETPPAQYQYTWNNRSYPPITYSGSELARILGNKQQEALAKMIETARVW